MMDSHNTSGSVRNQSTTYKVDDSDWQVWSNFANISNTDQFCQSWLAIQCRQIEGVIGGLVLMGPPGTGPFKPMAVWPDVRNDMRHLSTIAEKALGERRGLLIKGSAESDATDPHSQIAYPMELNDKLFGVIVLEVTARADASLQAVLRQIHWGSAWLEILLRKQQNVEELELKNRVVHVLDSLAGIVDQEAYQTSLLTFVTELSTRFHCARVSIGFRKRNRMVVTAMSHNAQFNAKSNLARAIGAAMDEAADQSEVISYPNTGDNKTPLVTRAHEELLRTSEAKSVCSIPISKGNEIQAVLTLERDTAQPFTIEDLETFEALASLAGPILLEKKQNDKWVLFKIKDSIHRLIGKLIGPRHVGLKLATILIASLAAFFTIATGDFRVTANTIIEGQIQRVAVTPFSAYVAESKVRAGDVVSEGEVIAILDDRDIKLEQKKLLGQKQQAASQYREAMANHDKAQVRIATARSKQIQAQLELVEYKLSRTKIVAPFSGVIVNGDLSQMLGAPLEKGQVLFEIAPLDAYRIILQVDERDVAHIKEGQLGSLVLSSIPDKDLIFTVKMVTPVSTAKEGRNYFRVEAELSEFSQKLRPGMEGVGKIKIGKENLFWIWTYKITDWLRLWFWSWLP